MSASEQNEISRLTNALNIGSSTSNSRRTTARTSVVSKIKQDRDGEIETPSQKFTLFGSLPTELRLQIWAYALRRPTLVPVALVPLKPVPFIRHGMVSSNWATNYHRPPPSIGAITIPLHISTLNIEERIELDNPSRINLSNLSGFKSTLPPPQLIYVNHEAHKVVSTAFTKAFAAHCAISTTWFNYERDTLLLRMGETTETCLLYESHSNFLEEALSRMILAERSLVKHVCIDFARCTESSYLSYLWLGWSVALFPNCKTLSFELPDTKEVLRGAAEELHLDDSILGERRDLFAECFEDYRKHGTVQYEVTEWKEYVEGVHGEKGLVVRECCVDSLGEDGECDGECFLMT